MDSASKILTGDTTNQQCFIAQLRLTQGLIAPTILFLGAEETTPLPYGGVHSFLIYLSSW